MTMDNKRLNVLVVEDSPVVRMLLVHLLKSDPRFDAITTANDGDEAVAAVLRHPPDVVVMDMFMPKLDGLQATRQILATVGVPIVVCSSTLKRDEVGLAFRAMEAGALAFVEKPVGPGHPDFNRLARDFRETLALLGRIAVNPRRPELAEQERRDSVGLSSSVRALSCVAIGASTGGPPALRGILARLPAGYPSPILVVQHLPPGFLFGLAEWLRQAIRLPVKVAQHGEPPCPGHVYLAPDDHHLGLAADGLLQLSQDPLEHGCRPSVDCLFRSVHATCGSAAAGILLSGMGRDGVDALLQMRQAGAVTIVQDAESAAINGMSGEAVARGAAQHVLPPAAIAGLLLQLAGLP